MKMRNRVFLLLAAAALMFTVSAAGAQEVSEKKDISVFSLYYDEGLMSSNDAMNIDAAIQRVFTNMGRFNVIGSEFRLKAGDVSEFIQKIRDVKAANAEIPREVQLGREIFTEADFKELTGSFLVVVPSVLRWETTEEEGDYTTELKLSVNIIDVDKGSSLKILEMEFTGMDDSASASKQAAIGSIFGRMEYEIRKMPVFQIKTGVLDVSLMTVELELGRNMGIKIGDEYALREQGISNSGYEYSNEVGLVVIKDVQEEFSKATILYGKPNVGDQLQEIPRAGANLGFYANFLQRLNAGTETDLVVGLRATGTRGFYAARPVFGMEIPFINVGAGLDFLFIPFQAYIGGEYNLYLGRLQISPMVAVAYGGLYPIWEELGNAIADVNGGQEWINSHFGGRAQLGITYLLGRDMRLYLEGGGTFMYGLFGDFGDAISTMNADDESRADSYSSFLETYYGYYVGGGITFKL